MNDPTLLDSKQIFEDTAALILAAGGARRMGSPKALLQWRGRSLLRHIAEVAAATPCGPIHVVLGCEADALMAELVGLDVEITQNEEWKSGIGSSVAAGVSRLPDDCRGLMLLLCDQPFATPELLRKMLEARDRSHSPMAACRYGGTLGPPAYFDASLFGRLKSLRGDRGAKSLLLEEPDRVATVEFARGTIDIDTTDDYVRALEILETADPSKGS
jgi:molybdenum cofactor cytidylyltransferase